MSDDTNTSCAIEPIAFENALFACLSQKKSLSLHELEGLSLLADAVILFDGLIFLNCHTPTIRHLHDPKDRHEIAKSLLIEKLKWGFVTPRNLMDFTGSDWFSKAYASKPKDEYKVEVLGKNVRRTSRIPDPIIGLRSWNEVMYLDKVNNATAVLGAVVAHDRENRELLNNYYWPKTVISVDFIRHYERTLKERFEKSRLSKFRELNHYAPYFLSAALNHSACNHPQDVLTVLAQMRDEVTKKYRDLCKELLVSDPLQGIKVVEEIENVLGALALTDIKVPRAIPSSANTAITVAKSINTVYKGLKGDGETLEKIFDVSAGIFEESEEIKKVYDDSKKYDIHRSLKFFNRMHFMRPSVETFYKDLKRVFSEVDFTEQQLRKFLADEKGLEIKT